MVMAKEEISPVGRDDIDVVAVDLLVVCITEIASMARSSSTGIMQGVVGAGHAREERGWMINNVVTRHLAWSLGCHFDRREKSPW